MYCEGLYKTDGSGITFIAYQCTISNNKASSYGGGMYVGNVYGSTNGDYEYFSLCGLTMEGNKCANGEVYDENSYKGSMIYFNRVRYVLLKGTTTLTGVVSFNNKLSSSSTVSDALFYTDFSSNVWSNKKNGSNIKFKIYPQDTDTKNNYHFMTASSSCDSLLVNNSATGMKTGLYFEMHSSIYSTWGFQNQLDAPMYRIILGYGGS